MNQPTHKEKPCERCNEIFTYKVCYIGVGEDHHEAKNQIHAYYCDKCKVAIEKEHKQAEIKQRQKEKLDRWHKICPPLYRIPTLSDFPPPGRP